MIPMVVPSQAAGGGKATSESKDVIIWLNAKGKK